MTEHRQTQGHAPPIQRGSYDLREAIELHSEASDPEFVRLAAASGLAAMVIKWPGGPDSAPVARFLSAESAAPLALYGGIVLDRTVGGLNAAAVEASYQHGGRFVWMPVVDALHHRRRNAQDEAGVVHVTDAHGELLPEVREVLAIVAARGMALGTGHIGPEETRPLVEAATGVGVRTVLINHPLLLGYSPAQIHDIAAFEPVIIEHCYVPDHPKPFDVGRIVEAIQDVGTDKTVIADFGKFGLEANVADALVSHGMDIAVVRELTVTTPAKVLARHG